MALIDLIANSGGQNFETMRKGWLPTAEETNARKMSELGIQQRQQEIDYEPERQSYLKQKRKADLKSQKQSTELFDEKMKKYKTDEQIAKKDSGLKIMSNITRGAFAQFKETKDISVAQEIFRQNYNSMKEAGDDDQDKQLDKFLDPSTTTKEAEKMLAGLNSVLPMAQEALDKQRIAMAKSGGSTLYERLKQRKVLGLIDAEDQKKLDKLSGETSSDQFDKKMEFKEKQHDVVQAKFDYTKIKNKSKRTDKFSGDYKKDSESLIKFNSNLDEIMIILNSENNALTDKLLTAKLMNLEKTSIRAMGFYEVFNQSMGNIGLRLKDAVVGFIGGKRDQGQLDIIRSTVEQLQEKSKPALAGRARFSRTIAEENGLDPFKVVPPTSNIDILESPLLNKKEKIRLLERYGSTFKK